MNEEPITLTALDQMVTSDSTQILKALVPYLPLGMQGFFSIYTKSKELSKTISLFSPRRQNVQMQAASAPLPASPMELLEDMAGCCTGQMRQKIQDMKQMMAMVQMMQMMNDSTENEDMKGEADERGLEK